MYDKQAGEAGDARHATLAQMQNLIYDEAPYDVLFYDANLDVYRNDKFAGWREHAARRDADVHLRHPQLHEAARCDGGAAAHARGTVRAGFGGAAQSEAPGAPTAAPSPSASTGSGDAASGSGSNTTLLLALVAVVGVVVAGGLIWSRRRSATNVEDE